MISKERLYLAKDGTVVKHGDERAVALLVCAGGELPDALAEKYGLKPGKAEPKQVPPSVGLVEDRPLANKAIKPMSMNKR